MKRPILVHVRHGPEQPSAAALGFVITEPALRRDYEATR